LLRHGAHRVQNGMRRAFLKLIVFVWLPVSVGQAQSFLFVSPNTRDLMSDESALGSLDSFEQTNFVAVARHLGTRLCPGPQVANAEGMDGMGAENSILVTGCKSAEARYLGELLGQYAHQKWILVFDPEPKGSERLFVITFVANQPEDTLNNMRGFGIKAATVVPAIRDGEGDQRVRVYLWIQDRSQESAVHAFAVVVHGAVEEIAGKGTMIGAESRTSAQKTFAHEIKVFERAHHRRLSKLLRSKTLHHLGASAVPK
jgi:hypothetical protein